jgi:hypothetical protein
VTGPPLRDGAGATTPATDPSSLHALTTQPHGTAPTHRDYALAYAARGWPVFPVKARAKAPPLTRNGCKDATTNPDAIRRWWTQVPDANIGLATGTAIDALDVDGYEGWRSVALAVAEYGCLASSPVTSTPRGGAHFLYLPTGVGLRAGFLPSVDWRGRGGYIIAPPSVGANGIAYGWAVKPSEQPLEWATRWLIELLEGKADPEDASIATANISERGLSPVARTLNGRHRAYVAAALRGEVYRVATAPQGARNHTLNEAAFALGQLVGARLLDADEAGQELARAAIGNGLTEREVYGSPPDYNGTVQSGLTAGIAQPRRVAS